MSLAVQMAVDILAQNPVDHDHLNYIPLPDLVLERGDYGGYARFAVRQQVSNALDSKRLGVVEILQCSFMI